MLDRYQEQMFLFWHMSLYVFLFNRNSLLFQGRRKDNNNEEDDDDDDDDDAASFPGLLLLCK